MRKTNVFSLIFGFLGLMAAVGGILLALGNRAAKPMLLSEPEKAKSCISQTMDSLCLGDYETAEAGLYGQPRLGLDREAADPVGQLVWEAFQKSLSYEQKGSCYTTDTGLAQDLVIHGLDISSITATLGQRSQDLLTQRVAEAKDPEELYDENYDYREDLVMEVLYEAAQQALEQDAQERTWEITVNLVYENGQWWILPESGLLEAISGGILK